MRLVLDPRFSKNFFVSYQGQPEILETAVTYMTEVSISTTDSTRRQWLDEKYKKVHVPTRFKPRSPSGQSTFLSTHPDMIMTAGCSFQQIQTT